MEKRLLDLSRAPDDPIERIVWLDGVMEQVRDELDEAFSEAYFWARFTGRLDAALALKRHSRKRVMAYTRAMNNQKGRQIRWNDGRS
jgi:hypothetical protein